MKIYLKAAVKIFIYVAIPMAFLTLMYKIILDYSFGWSFFLYYLPIISLASAHHYMPATLDTGIPPSKDFAINIKKELETASWKIVDETAESILLRPNFNRPYIWIYPENVLIDLSGNRVRLSGAKQYIKRLKALIDGKKTLWDRKSFHVFSSLLLILAILLPAFYEYGVITDMRIRLNEHRTRNVEIIKLAETGITGNTEDNINSYGGAVETGDYLFYVKEGLNLCRSDKNFENEKMLIDKPSGSSISYLNATGEWIYFTSGKTLNRIKTDGSRQETIYSMGYLLDVHLLDNWIYFINPSDRFRLYKMDINGKNLHSLSDLKITDFSIYDGRIYFSHEKDGQGVLEGMNLNGQDVNFIAEILPFDLVKNGDTLYYTDKRDFNLYSYELTGTRTPKRLVDKELSRFIVARNWIYYSLKSEDVYYPGMGLYKIGLDGSSMEKITGDGSIEHLNRIGEWILFHSANENHWPTLKRMSLNSQTIIGIN
jgi:hypothetical protein